MFKRDLYLDLSLGNNVVIKSFKDEAVMTRIFSL